MKLIEVNRHRMTELLNRSMLHDDEMEEGLGDVFGCYTVNMNRLFSWLCWAAFSERFLNTTWERRHNSFANLAWVKRMYITCNPA